MAANRVDVLFRPSGRRLALAPGRNLLEAAREAGLPVAQGQTTDVGELEKGTSGTLEIEITDQNGNPVFGTLQIRDRAYESWAKVVEEGTTLNHALDAIPKPQMVRLEAGKASLGRIAAGRIDLILALDAGGEIHFERDLQAGETNRIQLTLPR